MKQELIKNNYIYVPNFISKNEASYLAKEFYLHSKLIPLDGDVQAPNSECVLNFLPFIRLQVEKIQEVGELCGEKVLPTYTYARIYKHGSVLNRHKDRDACEISLTINLEKDVDWPIWFEKPNGEQVSIELQPGDAAIYQGCIAWHWREQYAGKSYVQLFTHYVRSHGPRAWAFYDKTFTNKPAVKPKDIPVTWL